MASGVRGSQVDPIKQLLHLETLPGAQEGTNVREYEYNFGDGNCTSRELTGIFIDQYIRNVLHYQVDDNHQRGIRISVDGNSSQIFRVERSDWALYVSACAEGLQEGALLAAQITVVIAAYCVYNSWTATSD